MIVVDTSALLAVLQGEPAASDVERVLAEQTCVMSTSTWVELAIVVEARTGAGGAQLLDELRDRIGLSLLPVDETVAAEAVRAWRRFGKGRHPAGLNFGDVFSYALARVLDAPLLFVGSDFPRTDIARAG